MGATASSAAFAGPATVNWQLWQTEVPAGAPPRPPQAGLSSNCNTLFRSEFRPRPVSQHSSRLRLWSVISAHLLSAYLVKRLSLAFVMDILSHSWHNGEFPEMICTVQHRDSGPWSCPNSPTCLSFLEKILKFFISVTLWNAHRSKEAKGLIRKIQTVWWPLFFQKMVKAFYHRPNFLPL